MLYTFLHVSQQVLHDDECGVLQCWFDDDADRYNIRMIIIDIVMMMIN